MTRIFLVCCCTYLTTVFCLRVMEKSTLEQSENIMWWEPSFEVSLVKPNGHTLAVLVVGLQSRLTFVSKLTHVMEPAVAQGYNVLVYVELVKSGFESGKWWNPPSNLTSGSYTDMPDLEHVLRQKIEAAGAHLEIFHLVEGNDDAVIKASLELGMEDHVERFSYYSPFQSTVGQNVMRRFLSLQRLWGNEAWKQDPSFVLVTRDDNFWLGPLNLDLFLHMPNSSETVYSKDCKSFKGINDKTLLFGRTAAKRGIRGLFKNFWDKDASLQTKNAETFWQAHLQLCNVTSTPVPLQSLPTADAVYQMVQGQRTQCLRKFYMCNLTFEVHGHTPPECVE